MLCLVGQRCIRLITTRLQQEGCSSSDRDRCCQVLPDSRIRGAALGPRALCLCRGAGHMRWAWASSDHGPCCHSPSSKFSSSSSLRWAALNFPAWLFLPNGGLSLQPQCLGRSISGLVGRVNSGQLFTLILNFLGFVRLSQIPNAILMQLFCV